MAHIKVAGVLRRLFFKDEGMKVPGRLIHSAWDPVNGLKVANNFIKRFVKCYI
jgi:hypothetical protein